ncbi:hypothetical protein A176_004108 [Myxococcus hansupus]|uniref:Uncharacterized protein n=1 Tax=Pseudomyxococcus hansupus TaxID=1297742 RepID=A0A0H4WUU6_9BACT|nr:hypothetical protein A176_004108 [Myxococcus hansupus]
MGHVAEEDFSLTRSRIAGTQEGRVGRSIRFQEHRSLLGRGA